MVVAMDLKMDNTSKINHVRKNKQGKTCFDHGSNSSLYIIKDFGFCY